MLHVPSGHTKFPYNPEHYPSTLDLAISNNIHNITRIVTLNELDSDHLPIVLIISKVANDVKPQNDSSEVTYDYNKIDWDIFTRLYVYPLTYNSK